MALSPRVPEEIAAFLAVETPAAWIDAATRRLPELLNDHANCELKAASTALGFIYRYPERAELCAQMSRLAREELRHYEQVRQLMKRLEIPYQRLSASRYAGELRKALSPQEPARLLDSLLIGALIEARSCERFAMLEPYLESPVAEFYRGLLRSEARHFQNYLRLAREEVDATGAAMADRLSALTRLEAQLIESADNEFRFHSGSFTRNGAAG